MADTWTIDAMRRWSCDYFKKYGIETPQLDADILLADTLGVERIQLLICGDQVLTPENLAQYKTRILRRAKNREPIAYILGHREFWSMEFDVTPDTLIPRPDTECLVEAVLEAIKTRTPTEVQAPEILDIPAVSASTEDVTREALPDERLASYVELWADQDSAPELSQDQETRREAIPEVDDQGNPLAQRDIYADVEKEETTTPSEAEVEVQPKDASLPALKIVDIGTGTGAIAIALASELNDRNAEISAVDISAAALAVAKSNAKKLGFDKIQFIQSDLLNELHTKYDVIVSNPPYVSQAEYANVSPEVQHEPQLALIAENNGLSIYERLVPQSFAALTQGGILAVEIGFTQGEAVSEIFKRAGFESIVVKPDYAGLPRIVLGRRP